MRFLNPIQTTQSLDVQTGVSVKGATVIDASGKIDWGTIKNKPASFTASAHDHNDIYYTKTQLQTAGQSAVDYANLTNVPVSFPAESHNHDDRYYTKNDSDLRYYQQSQITTILEGYSKTDHTHTFSSLTSKPTTLLGYGITDAHTKTEITTLLNGKSNTDHTHTFSEIQTKPTTLSGYGITDAYTKLDVDNQFKAIIGASPATLDTLNELAAALGNDPNFATTMTDELSKKANAADVYLKTETYSRTEVGTNFLGINANATSASKLYTARKIILGGDLSGEVLFDGSQNVTLSATVADDSHNHIITDVDGLTDALAGKAAANHTHGTGDLPTSSEIAKQTLTGATITAAYFAFAQTPINPTEYSAQFKITCTSPTTTIGSVSYVWVIGQYHYAPQVIVMTDQKSTSATTTGLYYVRVVYPKTTNNGYRAYIELYSYNTTQRDYKIEMIESTNVEMMGALTASPLNGTYHNSGVTSANGDGIVTSTFYGSLSGNASSASWASNLYNSSFKAGETLATNDIIYLDTATNLWYKANVAGRVIPIGSIIGRSAGAYTTASTSVGSYYQGYATLPAGLTGTINVGKDIYIRGIWDGADFTTDGTITTELDPGYAYIRFGQRINTTASTVLYDGNNQIYVVDTNGNMSYLQGLKIEADTLDGKHASDFALASHGAHIPTPEVANNAKFLRNDNSWQLVTPANIGAAPSSHSHAINDITNLSTTLQGKSDTNHTHTFASLQEKPTTLLGFGITDAYTSLEVDNKISALVDSAPGTLDTLNELAAALGDDPNFATTISTELGKKAYITDVYSKTNLQTSGSAMVHWGNITNAPASFTPSAHSHTLDDLSDVALTAPTSNHYLVHNGAGWINQALPSGTTAQVGIVQLSTSTSSTSTALAATASAVKAAYDIGAAALPKSGGIMTGKITTPNSVMGIRLGDDVEIGDVNVANHMGVQGVQDPTTGGFVFGSGKDTNLYRGGANILKTDDRFEANTVATNSVDIKSTATAAKYTIEFNETENSLDFVFG